MMMNYLKGENMNLKRICYLTLVGLLLKGGHNVVQANGTHTSYLNSSASFTHYFSQLPAGNWSLRITNNYSVSQYFTGSMYN